jgi:hypothetical protein
VEKDKLSAISREDVIHQFNKKKSREGKLENVKEFNHIVPLSILLQSLIICMTFSIKCVFHIVPVLQDGTIEA